MRKQKMRDIVLIGLLNNPNVSAASRDTGVSESTIRRYLKDNDFMQIYEEQRKELLRNSCYMLQANQNKAITELVKVIDDKEVATQVKLNAIDMLLRHSYKMTEQLDIIERLDKLEQLM